MTAFFQVGRVPGWQIGQVLADDIESKGLRIRTVRSRRITVMVSSRSSSSVRIARGSAGGFAREGMDAFLGVIAGCSTSDSERLNLDREDTITVMRRDRTV